MATKFEGSPRPAPRGWISRLGAGPTLSREDIERDAAATLGVPVDLLGQPASPASEPEAEEHSVPVARGGDRRPGRVPGWLRDLVSPEPADVRRQRLEAEAAAELGFSDHAEHAVQK